MSGSPRFAIAVPAAWSVLEPFNEVSIAEEWETAIKQLFEVRDEEVLHAQLSEIITTLKSIATVKVYSYVAMTESDLLAMTATLNLLPIRRPQEQSIDSFLVGLIKRLDGTENEAHTSILSIEHGWSGEFLRAERIAEADSASPWPNSRIVRCLFSHPDGDGVAVLTCSTPNIQSREVIEIFDTVSKTFVWIPKAEDSDTPRR